MTASIGINWATNDQIEDFHLSSNDENFGAFDDVVIKVKSVTGSNVSALQLKHNDRGNLPIAKLKQEHGDFSIKKYFISAQSINCHVDSYILYTNLKLNVKENTRFWLDGEDFQVGLSKFEPKDVIFQFSDKLSHCYKCHVVEVDYTYDYSPEILMYKNFFQKFYLFVNQDNSRTLEAKIAEKFKKLFLANQTECDAYMKMISRWSQQQGEKLKLCKSWVQRAIALTLLSSRIKPLSFGSSVNENMQILREAISAFTVTVFENNTYHKIKDLWGDAMSQIKDTKELNKTREMYHLSQSYIKSLDNLDLKLLNTLLWLNGKCPIIVTEDAVVQKMIKLCPEAKFIVLVDDISEEITGYDCSVFRDLSDLKAPCRDTILEKFNFSIQGKGAVCLKNVFSFDFLHAIRTSDLVEMLHGPYVVGGLQDDLPEPYIDRYLWRNIINVKYFENNDEDTLIVIDCVQEIDSLKPKLKNCNILNVEDYLNEQSNERTESSTFKISVFITPNRCQKMHFDAICDKNKDTKNYHHLRFIDVDSFEWIQSKGNISSLEEHKMTNFILTEKELWSGKLENNINLIVSNPGMGKTESMKSLKNTSPSEIWTIFMNPTDMCLFSKYVHGNNLANNLDTLQDFLLTEKYKSSDERAKEFLPVFVKQDQVYYVWDALDEVPVEYLETITNLIVQLSEQGKVQWITSRFQLKHLLEVKFNVLSLNLCQFSEQEQIIYIKKRLENVDTIEDIEEIISTVRSSFALVEHKEILGIPLQIFMLTNLLRKNINKYFTLLSDIFVLTDLYHYFVGEKMEVYFEKTMGEDFKKFSSVSAVKILEAAILKYHQDLALRTLFSVDILKKLNIDFENNFEDSKEEYVSVGLLTKITSKPACFIHNSFAEYFAALYFSQNQRLSSIFVDVIFEPRFVNVRFFFDLLLAKESPAHVAVLYKNINLLEKYGHQIRTGTDAGDRSVLHVASSWGQRHPQLDVATTADAYIVDDSGIPHIGVEKAENLKILNYLLTTCDLSQYDTLFKMTPLLYAQRSNCLVIELKILKQLNRNLLHLPVENIVNILYYTAVCGYDDVIDHLNLEISASTDGQDSNILRLDQKILDARNAMNVTLLHQASGGECEKIVKFLVEQGANVDSSDTLGATPLYVASQIGYHKIVEFLVGAGAEINRGKVNGVTSLFIACQFGHIKVVERLLALGADPNKPRDNGATPLHITSELGDEDLTQLLVASGAEINCGRTDGFTPLSTACEFGQFKLVKRLLELGANINQSRETGVTPLHLACEFGYEDITELLLASGAEINSTRVDGITPLFTACQYAHIKIVARLLALGADSNQPRDTGATPLHIACEKGQEEIVERLVASGAEINHTKVVGVTPLFTACQFGHIKIVQRLIALGADPNQSRDVGATPLHVACEFGHKEVIEHLAASGAEINRGTVDGITPLLTACQFGYIKIVKRLLALGADSNQATNTGDTPLHGVCEFGYEEIIDLLVTSGTEINCRRVDGTTPLFTASQFGHIKVVERLITLGANPNQPNNVGATPLHVACEFGFEEIIELLVAFGAEINRRGLNGNSPLAMASGFGHTKIVERLLMLGANPNQPNDIGATALHIACEFGYEDITELLVASGAEINRDTMDGSTPLFVACQFGQTKVAERLLVLGADPNQPRDIGVVPLHVACELGHDEIVELLVASGAEINHGTVFGITPLFIACEFGHRKVVERLLVLGANINQTRNTGATPLYVACETGHEHIVELLVASGADINLATYFGPSPLSIALEKGNEKIVEILRGRSKSSLPRFKAFAGKSKCVVL
ncbi:uncharacterized protein LOC135123608 isoform X2 [Zophobas morio]